MHIRKHAIRRYKQRVGGKTASSRRIRTSIQKEIKHNTVNKYFSRKKGQVLIETGKFTAVCYNNTIITILPPNEKHRKKEKMGNLNDEL